jgi:hypothetical protein
MNKAGVKGATVEIEAKRERRNDCQRAMPSVKGGTVVKRERRDSAR